MLFSRLTAELTLKGTLGAAVLIMGGLSFIYNWQVTLLVVLAMTGMNLLTELYTASCIRVGSSTGMAGIAGQFITLICMLYLIWGAVNTNWIIAVTVIIAVIVAACLPYISQLGIADNESYR